jgi:hypothetical protein
MRYFASLLTALVLVLCLQSTSFAACVTHFYNQSNFPWSISGYNGTNSNLVVAPNTTVEIQWATSTSVVISGAIPNRPYVRQFQVEPSGACFLILSPGNTGIAFINTPTNGDVTTCSGNC